MTTADPAGPYRRPVPLVGDATSASARRDDPAGWSLGSTVQEALASVVAARRDVRRYRADPVPDDLVRAVLQAGHAGPSVGHSQPWRFIVVTAPALRDRAAHLADRARLAQARQMAPDRAARLLDLRLEGLREAPVGVVVACDRRTPAAGVLGRATFGDTDLWSCACAIENMWLTARAHGLGMGWVTLFEPADLAELLSLPEGVETLGWLCLGWPDERPPAPGLERAGWSRRMPLSDVVMADGWSDTAAPPPDHRLAGPSPDALVAATDAADELLTPPDSLGVLDRVVSRVRAIAGPVTGGTLILAAADHPVARSGVSAYPETVTRDVTTAAVAGTSQGAAAARGAGLAVCVVDCGVAGAPVAGAVDARPRGPRGDLITSDALTPEDVDTLLARGEALGRQAAGTGLVVLGEVGVGNTTVAGAVAGALTGGEPSRLAGLGSGADSPTLERKTQVIQEALARCAPRLAATATAAAHARELMATVGGPEIVLLTGVVLGAAGRAPVILDGLAASLPGLLATRLDPGVQGYLVAGQRSRERAHGVVLEQLGLEPLLSLRLRAGEGVGAAMAASLILQGVRLRDVVARTAG